MIPSVYQSRPNVLVEYRCSKCKVILHDGRHTRRRWNFCPECGEQIEWEKVKPYVWEDLDCEICGARLVWHRDGQPYASTDYIGLKICRICRMQECLDTNCLGCEEGEYPTCRFSHLKALARGDEDFHFEMEEEP